MRTAARGLEGGEADEQQRLASMFFAPPSDPRRKQHHRELRHNDQGGNKGCRFALARLRQITADERQH